LIAAILPWIASGLMIGSVQKVASISASCSREHRAPGTIPEEPGVEVGNEAAGRWRKNRVEGDADA
jgi:hypothetical protein